MRLKREKLKFILEKRFYEMSFYELQFTEIAKKQYECLDNSIKQEVKKKLIKLTEREKKRRHLRFGEPYFVDEVGQYRIIYEIIDTEIVILVLFIGKHSDYEKYLRKK